MQANELLDMIGEVEEELILDARTKPKRKQSVNRMKWFGAIAACLLLVIGAGGLIRTGLNELFSNGSGAGGSGHEDGSVFMSYAGPVFPLALREENAAISAQRTITMDFEEYAGAYGKIPVSDAYVLTNEENEDRTVHILYPFASMLMDLEESRPVLTLNGEELPTELYAGSYSGRFQGAWENGTEENPGSLNLLDISSWEDYQTLLSDGSYLARALGEPVDLSDIPVTLYTFTDAWGMEENRDKGIPNPTMRVMFEMDYEKTTILSYGFNGNLFDEDKGMMGKEFSIPQPGERYYGNTYYIIVIGEDIKNITCQGYATGGWDTKKKIEAGVNVTRSESDLETVLCLVANDSYQEEIAMYSNPEKPEYSFELYYGLLKEHLVAYGPLSENPASRYSSGGLEFLDVVTVDRVFWLEAEITVPAESSVLLEAICYKEPSFDYHCAATDNKGVNGYDMVTKLGSNLTFTKQSARLEDHGKIEIVRQNFGFDLERGVNEVELDLEQPHYYLEVKEVIQGE